MPKGLFTGCTVALFEKAPTVEALEEALASFGVRARSSSSGENPWLGGPGVMLEMESGLGGVVSVDIVEEPWPDDMGDPEQQPELFGAWTLGALGPFTFPGSLERAVQQAREWDAGAAARDHRAFVRIRPSYVLGKGPEEPVLPEGYDPIVELYQLTAVARALLDLPDSLGYFNPSGEVLMNKTVLDSSMHFHAENELPPFEAWAAIRVFQLGDIDGWTVMDTIGMEQLELRDQEVCFPEGACDPNEVAVFLRNLALYLLSDQPDIHSGDTIDGPGGNWSALLVEESLAPAPRGTIRWTRVEDEIPAALKQTKRETS